MYTIDFASTNTSIRNLSLNELVFELSEHYARVGVDLHLIFISNSETHELYEVINNEQLNFNHMFYSEKLGKEYNILDLVNLLPYI